jgi:hypothetical protein
MKKFIFGLIILIVGIYIGANFMMSSKPDELQLDDNIQASTVDTDTDDNIQTSTGDTDMENSQNTELKEEQILPEPEDIYADFWVKVNPDNSFLIETNLPDETELSLTLKGRGYIAQGEAIVKDGQAVSPVFTNHGNALDGNYELQVLMPIPNVQSDYVKHFIGNYGQYLKGEYVKPYIDSVVVQKKFDVTLSAKE